MAAGAPGGDDRAVADAVAIARVLAGDAEVFAVLIQRYQTALYRHAVSMVVDRDAAADMVQDAFIRAYTNLGACRDTAKFRAWLFQTLRNRCLDYLKEASRRTVPLEPDAVIVDESDGPVALAEQGEQRRAMRAALETLPMPQREAFVLRYVEGCSYDEIADRLGASVSALKMRVLRARERLAAALGAADMTHVRPARADSPANRERDPQRRALHVEEQ